tara:strand:+ start:262 stop:477 length:216 start_codon:yes stop_codon:yes gene_type:complete
MRILSFADAEREATTSGLRTKKWYSPMSCQCCVERIASGFLEPHSTNWGEPGIVLSRTDNGKYQIIELVES